MKVVFFSNDIACGGCTATIEKVLSTMLGVIAVNGDPSKKTVVVDYEESGISVEALLAKLNELGFESQVVT